jgi:hypothetical protein
MGGARGLGALFLRPKILITVVGNGAVTTNPLGVFFGNCSHSGPGSFLCNAGTFRFGAQVTLTATGRTFLGWSGDCTGGALTCVIVIDRQEHRVAAVFNP